jgi:hypothetical protein
MKTFFLSDQTPIVAQWIAFNSGPSASNAPCQQEFIEIPISGNNLTGVGTRRMIPTWASAISFIG